MGKTDKYPPSVSGLLPFQSATASPMLLEGHNLAVRLCPQLFDQFSQVVHRLEMGGFVPLKVTHGDVHRTMPKQMRDGTQPRQLCPLRACIMPKAVGALLFDFSLAAEPKQAIPKHRPLVGLSPVIEEDEF